MDETNANCKVTVFNTFYEVEREKKLSQDYNLNNHDWQPKCTWIISKIVNSTSDEIIFSLLEHSLRFFEM